MFSYIFFNTAQAQYKAPEIAEKATGSLLFSEIYFYALALVGASALLMIIIAAIKYIYAGDNESQVKEAKEMIYNAIFGLILALTSYVILNTINPQLLGLKELKDIEKEIKEKLKPAECTPCLQGQAQGSGCSCSAVSSKCGPGYIEEEIDERGNTECVKQLEGEGPPAGMGTASGAEGCEPPQGPHGIPVPNPTGTCYVCAHTDTSCTAEFGTLHIYNDGSCECVTMAQ